MMLPGETLLRLRDDARRCSRRSRPTRPNGPPRRITLVDVSMIGAAGRIYISGRPPRSWPRAATRSPRCSAVAGRDASSRERARPAGGDVMRPGWSRRAATRWPRTASSARGRLTLLNVSENATYLVDDPDDRAPSVLRVHRPGYHAARGDRLRAGLAATRCARRPASRTPRVLPAPDGRRVLTVPSRAAASRARRACSSSCPATEPPADDRAGRDFAELGAITARMHRHARGVAPAGRLHPVPLGLRRARSAPQARWGRWQDGIGVGAGGARAARPAGRRAARPAARVRLRAGPVRPRPRRHPAGQPARRRRPGQRHRLRRLRASAGSCTTSARRSASSSTTRACRS